jgi:hypothetical protein
MPEIPEEIRERLEAAERVCLLVGWLPVQRGTDRGEALALLWQRWHHAYGGEIDDGEGSLGLDESAIADLARQHREIDQLEHMRNLRDPEGGDHGR